MVNANIRIHGDHLGREKQTHIFDTAYRLSVARMEEEWRTLYSLENVAFGFMTFFFLILLSHRYSTVHVTGYTICSWEFKKFTSRRAIQNVKRKTYNCWNSNLKCLLVFLPHLMKKIWSLATSPLSPPSEFLVLLVIGKMLGAKTCGKWWHSMFFLIAFNGNKNDL